MKVLMINGNPRLCCLLFLYENRKMRDWRFGE